MRLSDLNEDERVVLAALIKTIVFADGRVSADEAEMLPEIIDEIGDEPYRSAFATAAERLADEAALKAFLPRLHRPEACHLIYATIQKLAAADAVSDHERPLLAWLRATWKVPEGTA